MSITIVCTLNSNPIEAIDSNRHIRRIGKLIKTYNPQYYKNEKSKFDFVVGHFGYENPHIIWHMREILSLGYFELEVSESRCETIISLLTMAKSLELRLGFANWDIIDQIFNENNNDRITKYAICFVLLEARLGINILKDNNFRYTDLLPLNTEIENKIQEIKSNFIIKYFEEPNLSDFFNLVMDANSSYKNYFLKRIKNLKVSSTMIIDAQECTKDLDFILDYLKSSRMKEQLENNGSKISSFKTSKNYYEMFLIVIKLMQYLKDPSDSSKIMRYLFMLNLGFLEYFIKKITNALDIIITNNNIPLQSREIITCSIKLNLSGTYNYYYDTRTDVLFNSYTDLFVIIVTAINSEEEIVKNHEIMTLFRNVRLDNDKIVLFVSKYGSRCLIDIYKKLYSYKKFDTNNILMDLETRQKFNKELGIGQGFYTKVAIKHKKN